jgi:PAS domain S-box-containing protein/diguanylate cyclase (GGDEF)-like protein
MKLPADLDQWLILAASGAALSLLFEAVRVWRRKSAPPGAALDPNRFRSIFDKVGVGVAVIDTASGRCTRVNARYGALLGYPEGEILDRDLTTLIHPDDRAEDRLQLRRLVSGEIRSFSREIRYRHQDGGVVWVHQHVLPTWAVGEAPTSHIAIVEDITARKRAEEALIEREDRYRAVVGTFTDGFLIVGMDGRIVETNDAYPRLSGYTKAELLTLRIADLEAQDGPEEIAQRIRQIMEQGHARFETSHRTKDGRIWPLEANVAYWPVTGAFFGYFQDISARKRMEREVQEQQERFRVAFDVSAVGMAQADPTTGEILRVNRRLCEMLGYSEAELLHHNFTALTHPEDRAASVEGFQRLARGEDAEFHTEKRYLRQDGEVLWAAVTASLIRDASGQPLCALALIQDIGERKRQEEQLLLTALVFDRAGEGIIVTDPQGRILTVNPAFTEVTGYTHTEAVGQNPHFISSGRHDAAFYTEMWHQIQIHGCWQGEIWNRRKTGEIYAEWLTVNSVHDAAGVLRNYVGIFTDLTTVKASQRRAEHLASHDELTGLPNRHALVKWLERRIAFGHRTQDRFAVLAVTLTNLQAINEDHGRTTGDAVLRVVAMRLQDLLRAGDLVARWGGTEFALLLPNADAATAKQAATRIREGIAAPIDFGAASGAGGTASGAGGTAKVVIDARIGIAHYSEDARDPEALLAIACDRAIAPAGVGAAGEAAVVPAIERDTSVQ